MIRKRTVSAASRIQRADAAMTRARSRILATEILLEEKAKAEQEKAENIIQEARDAYEQKCYALESAEVHHMEAQAALLASEEEVRDAHKAEKAAYDALKTLEKES